MFLHSLPHETLALIFARTPHADLDRLRRASRDFRTIAKKDATRRCQLARSVFDPLAVELCRNTGSSMDERVVYLREAYKGSRNGRCLVKIDIRMKIELVYDRLEIEVTEERDVVGMVISGSYAPARFDVLTVWVAENRVERNLNKTVHPDIPIPEHPDISIPESLEIYLCYNFMVPACQDDGMKIECTTWV